MLHYRVSSRVTVEGTKIWIATFNNSFSASRFADQQRKLGYNVYEPNPLVMQSTAEIEYWK